MLDGYSVCYNPTCRGLKEQSKIQRFRKGYGVSFSLRVRSRKPDNSPPELAKYHQVGNKNRRVIHFEKRVRAGFNDKHYESQPA